MAIGVTVSTREFDIGNRACLRILRRLHKADDHLSLSGLRFHFTACAPHHFLDSGPSQRFEEPSPTVITLLLPPRLTVSNLEYMSSLHVPTFLRTSFDTSTDER